jgi:hypothetical protein
MNLEFNNKEILELLNLLTDLEDFFRPATQSGWILP